MRIPSYRLKKNNNMYFLVKEGHERNSFYREHREEKDELGLFSLRVTYFFFSIQQLLIDSFYFHRIYW